MVVTVLGACAPSDVHGATLSQAPALGLYLSTELEAAGSIIATGHVEAPSSTAIAC